MLNIYKMYKMKYDGCCFCKNKMTKREIEKFESGESNGAGFSPLDHYPCCSKCYKIMCNECYAPCKNICSKCKKVCHAYSCAEPYNECEHRCKCYDNEIEDECTEAHNGCKLTTLQRKRLTYYRRMIDAILK